MTTNLFVIYSPTSRYSTGGLRPQADMGNPDYIVRLADYAMRKSGKTLEDLAGIAWLEDKDGNLHPERGLTPDEILTLSVEYLGSDGRLYETYTMAEADDFLAAAELYGVVKQAARVVAAALKKELPQ
jgi:hypothetical protein